MNTTRVIAIASVLASLAAGCETNGAADNVQGRVIVVDRTTQALLAADLLSINGTYGGACTNRTGNWSLEIADGADLDYDVLSVVRNDTDCTLTFTELRTTGGAVVAAPSFQIGTAYQGAASAMGMPIQFYANVRASALTFASDFVLTVLYSDDSELASGDHTADFTFQSASVDAESVPAPDNTLDLGSLVVQADIDDVVQAVSGSAVLTPVDVAGTRYAVVSSTGLTTYAAIDAAYLGATSEVFGGSVPASAFGLVGTDLTDTQVRTLIIANIEEGVRAYQTFEITFNPPERDPT